MDDEIKLTKEFKLKDIEEFYSKGFVLTRKKALLKVKSLRINLKNFELTSENRRVLKHANNLNIVLVDLPLKVNDTQWKIYKLAKDFYSKKFKDVKFSANKVREILTLDFEFPYFNKLAVFLSKESLKEFKMKFEKGEFDFGKAYGFAIIFETEKILHYAYPFYKIDFEKLSRGAKLNDATPVKNLGMAMMLNAILYSKNSGKDYIYLGSLSRPSDKYKLQFKSLEIV